MAQNNMGSAKKNLKNGTVLVFIDESGYRFTPFVARTWAFKGTKPTFTHLWRRRGKLSVISALVVWYKHGEFYTKMFFRIFQDIAISGKEVELFLNQIKYHLEGNVGLVWDNLSTHKGKEVKRFLAKNARFTSDHLPPYCPELNPDEYVWNWTKYCDLASSCPEDGNALKRIVRRSLRRFQRRKSLHLAGLKQSELSWNL